MLDIYGRTPQTFGGAFAADSAVLAFSGLGVAGGVGLLTQELSWRYQQRIMRLWEVGTSFTYYVVGRAEGGMSVRRVLGPRPLLFTFYSVYGNACNAASNTILLSVQQGCVSPFDPQAAATYRELALFGCVIQSVGFSIQAEQMMMNEQVEMMYVALIPPAGAP